MAGEDAKTWLLKAGLSGLAEMVEAGTPITKEDIAAQTAGLTPLQIHAVKERCLVLNGCANHHTPLV